MSGSISTGRSAKSVVIIRAVIGLGRSLDLPVLAEGVETASQMAFLSQEDCTEVQGFLIGRPAPIAAYAAMVRGAEAKPGSAGLSAAAG
jgi:EAL domain-containing protein (putative c-di-GMP-specific phosphodiesterase class I)